MVIVFWLPPAALHESSYCGVVAGFQRCNIPHGSSRSPVSRAMKADPLSLLNGDDFTQSSFGGHLARGVDVAHGLFLGVGAHNDLRLRRHPPVVLQQSAKPLVANDICGAEALDRIGRLVHRQWKIPARCPDAVSCGRRSSCTDEWPIPLAQCRRTEEVFLTLRRQEAPCPIPQVNARPTQAAQVARTIHRDRGFIFGFPGVPFGLSRNSSRQNYCRLGMLIVQNPVFKGL